MLKLQNTKKK